MFKFLTVFFVIYYINTVINQHKTLRECFSKVEGIKLNDLFVKSETKDKEIIKDYIDGKYTYVTEAVDDIVKYKNATKEIEDAKATIIVFSCLSLIILAIEMFYILFAFQYDKLIAGIYLVFWIVIYIYKSIKSKRKNKNSEFIITIENTKRTFSQTLINLVDVAYFGYMFFVLFIK